MSKKQPNPNDPAKVSEEARETPPEDVVHNAAENKASAEALAGEAIAGSDVPEARKAVALAPIARRGFAGAGQARRGVGTLARCRAPFPKPSSKTPRNASVR